ncbi:MAG: ABC transporter substrate-binding protein, partial [Chlamydiales bacterium]
MKDRIEENFLISSHNTARCLRWKLLPQFGNVTESEALASYIKNCEEILISLMPDELFFEDEKDVLTWIQEALPLVKWTFPETSPSLLSLLILCAGSKLQHTETLLLKLIRNQLIPDKEIPILSFQHLYFHFENFSHESLLFINIQILVEDSAQLSLFQQRAPLLTKEIAQVVKTRFFAHNFLEAKNLSQDFKSSLIYQDLVRLLQKHPHIVDRGIFTEAKRMLALVTKEFLDSRSPRHLAKILASHHMTRKIIMRAMGLFPEERHLQLRVAPTRLHFLFGTKAVMGLMISICLLDRYEFFDEKHVLLAVQKIIPGAQAVKGSYYVFQSTQDSIRTLYVEIEKRDAEPITSKEKGLLKKLLPNELNASVEKLIPSIFMVRNEEEIMKNILILSQELKYLSDLPQVMISFEQQSVHDLIFTVIMVRPLGKQTKPLDLLFDKIESPIEFILDRTQIVGYLRKQYPKEASTFRLRIPKDHTLLRADSSVNFYLARHAVIRILQEAVGEVRDYNGGMILQQVEQFAEMKNAFPEIAQRHPDLLEDFFYALTPIEMQATLPITHLHTLFRLLLDSVTAELPKRDSYVLKGEQKKETIFLLLRTKEPSYRDYVQRALNALEIFPKALCATHVDIQGSYCTGFIYDCPDSNEQGEFIKAVRNAILAWQEKLSSLKVLRLSSPYFPISLDPRIGGDEDSKRVIELLFDGLMRLDKEGVPGYAVAKSLQVSSDHTSYTFKLRDSFWSNGDRVTAYDFEYAWKKILSPNFSTPFAYLFYPIKNARLAREGKVPINDIGVSVI